MKTIASLVILVAGVVAYFHFKARSDSPVSTAVATAPADLAQARPQAPAPATAAPNHPTAPPPANQAATPRANVATVVPSQPAAAPGPEKMPFNEMLQPNNRFEDPRLGMGVTLPEGWSIREAVRWGLDHRENTVFFIPPSGSRAVPSMYYQTYPNGAPVPGNTEATLREMAQEKETSRRQQLPDYTNDPGSFVFREVNGQPALSYFATYSRGNEVQAEYFMRILGPQGYVMFFVRGPVQDVQAIIPPVSQMGGTVKAP